MTPKYANLACSIIAVTYVVFICCVFVAAIADTVFTLASSSQPAPILQKGTPEMSANKPLTPHLQTVTVADLVEANPDAQVPVVQQDYLPERLLKYFAYTHLPPHLQEVSKRFHDLAYYVVETLPAGPERTVALRKLLEAKDCAVRAALP